MIQSGYDIGTIYINYLKYDTVKNITIKYKGAFLIDVTCKANCKIFNQDLHNNFLIIDETVNFISNIKLYDIENSIKYITLAIINNLFIQRNIKLKISSFFQLMVSKIAIFLFIIEEN